MITQAILLNQCLLERFLTVFAVRDEMRLGWRMREGSLAWARDDRHLVALFARLVYRGNLLAA
ncbi:MAG: hypothetical protein DME45_06940 [Verrucomicrobia bacterium]|nr:MAG: hypothetical protein DME45_06940 [Verrucomicrobiota bacterium]